MTLSELSQNPYVSLSILHTQISMPTVFQKSLAVVAPTAALITVAAHARMQTQHKLIFASIMGPIFEELLLPNIAFDK